jgi:hypothetical protein
MHHLDTDWLNIGVNSGRYLKRYPGIFSYSKSNIYHYTNLEGLVGILSKKGFWLSDVRFLNDGEELYNGSKIAEQLIRKIKNKRSYSRFNAVLDIVLEKIQNESYPSCYICSFSVMGDMLEQWRAYGKNGCGISIGFDLTQKTEYPHFRLGPQYFTQEVIYKDSIKYWVLLSIIRSYKSDFYRAGRVNAGIIQYIADSLFVSLSQLFANFKHESFESEREVRIIDNSGKETFYREKFHRVSNGLIVPYFASYNTKLHKGDNIPIEPDNLPVTEIIVGPNTSQHELINSISIFLSDLGYDKNIQIRKSLVPYRG